MSWPPPGGASLLARHFLEARRGVPRRFPPVIPPHLEDATWVFHCTCGRSWTVAKASAVIVDGQVAPPRAPCTGLKHDPRDVGCGRWVSGVHVAFT